MSKSESTDDEFEEYRDVNDATVDAIIRAPSDEIMAHDGSYSFDPLGEQLSHGSVGDMDVNFRTARHRDGDTVDIVVEFGDGSEPDVHFDGNELIRTAVQILVNQGYESFQGFDDV